MSDRLPNSYSQLPQQQQQSGGEPMHGGMMDSSLSRQQIILALRSQVQQGNMTQQQAVDRLAMLQASSQAFQEQSVPQQFPPGFNAGAMPSGAPQQQMAGSGIASGMGQNLNPSGMGLPHGRGSSSSLATMPLPQLHALSAQLLHVVIEGEKNLQATSSSGEGDIQRQQLRAKIELNKQRLRALRGVISIRMGTSGDPTQRTVNGPSWSGSTEMPRQQNTLADMSLPQLRALSTQLMHVVMEAEKNFQATSSSGEGDIQRQQLRAKIELNKQRLRALHEIINMKITASGNPPEQAVNGPSLLPPASGRDPPQWDDSEPGRSPEGAMSHGEDAFDEEIEIAMSRLGI